MKERAAPSPTVKFSTLCEVSADDRGNEPIGNEPIGDVTSRSRQRPGRPVATTRRTNGSVDPREELTAKRPPSRHDNANSKRPSSHGAGSSGSNGSGSSGAGSNGSGSDGATAMAIADVARLSPVELPDPPAGPLKPRARQKPPRTTATPVIPDRPEPLVGPAEPIGAPNPIPIPMPMPIPIPIPMAPPDQPPTQYQPSQFAPVPQPIVVQPSVDDLGLPPSLFDDSDLDPDDSDLGPKGPPLARRVPRLSPGGRRTRPRVRRVTRVVRHVDPWSMFKVALCFSMVLYGVCLTAGVLLWNVAYTTGTIDNMQRFFESFGWTSFRFKGGELFHNAWIAGLFVAVGLTGLIVLAATLFNLITDLVGGIRVTVLEEEVVERNPAATQTLLRRRSSEMLMIRARRPGDHDGSDGNDSTGLAGQQPG